MEFIVPFPVFNWMNVCCVLFVDFCAVFDSMAALFKLKGFYILTYSVIIGKAK